MGKERMKRSHKAKHPNNIFNIFFRITRLMRTKLASEIIICTVSISSIILLVSSRFNWWFLLLRIFSVAISVSPRVCFILDLILNYMILMHL